MKAIEIFEDDDATNKYCVNVLIIDACYCGESRQQSSHGVYPITCRRIRLNIADQPTNIIVARASLSSWMLWFCSVDLP